MCGLVGVIGRPTFKAKEVFKDMLILDTVRGDDSTGIAAFGNSRAFVLKNTQLPSHLLSNPKFKKNVWNNYTDFHVLMGHNRAATQGKVVKRNAHPFHHGAITLMHNGTLYSHLYCDGTKFETDSEGIAYNISTRGIEDTWKRVSGPAALVWWDNSDKTINIITNGLRPIHFACTTDKEQVLWASEKWMIEVAAGRHKMGIGGIATPKENVLFQFSYDNTAHKVEGISSEIKAHTVTTVSRQAAWRQSKSHDRHAIAAAEIIGDHIPWIDERWGDQIARSMGDHPEYSVDKTGEKRPVNLSNPGGDSGDTGGVKRTIRYIDTETHRYDPIKNMYVPKDMLAEAALKEVKKNLAEECQKQDILRLPRPQEKVLGQHTDLDLEELRKKKITKIEFEDQYKECMSCSESMIGEYETAVIANSHNAICSVCVDNALSMGLRLSDVINAVK